MEAESKRLLLCAQLTCNGRVVRGHTVDVSESSAFVHTDERAYIGEQVEVRLWFPGLVEELTVDAHVVSCRLSSDSDQSGGWTLVFVFRSEAARERLRQLLLGDGGDRGEPTPSRYRVLLVEDNLLTRDVFSYRVEKYFRGRESGVTIDVAASAEEAWQKLSDEVYDLAIVDFYLPELTGGELIAKMRAHPTLRELPVVAISVGGEVARSATMAAGADMFLEKPVVLTDLFSTLDRLTVLKGAA